MSTLTELINSYRTNNQQNQGLLSKLKIGNNLYDIKDPAVEELATQVENRLSTLESKEWTPVTKDANSPKFATGVAQASDGSITVTYDNIRGTALNDSATAGQFITSVSQDINGVITTTKGGVSAGNVTFTPGSSFDSSSTTVQSAIEDALSQAMALKGTKAAGDTTSETIRGAKDYADAKVAELAGTDWSEAAHTVSEIIKELENSDTAGAWATMVDKMEGMSVSEKGTQGDDDYRPANSNPSVVEYVQAAIEDVNDANAEIIEGLDSVVRGNLGDNDAITTGHKVGVKITEVDGKLTNVTVVENDIASASDLTTLDNAVVKSINTKNPTNGAVTLYATDVAISSSDSTKISAALTTLSNDKANKNAIKTASINNWSVPTYASGTLSWSNAATNVYVPGTGSL